MGAAPLAGVLTFALGMVPEGFSSRIQFEKLAK